MIAKEKYDYANSIAQDLKKCFNYNFISATPCIKKDAIAIYISKDPTDSLLSTGKQTRICNTIIKICKANGIKVNPTFPDYTLEIDIKDKDTFVGLITLLKGGYL